MFCSKACLGAVLAAVFASTTIWATAPASHDAKSSRPFPAGSKPELWLVAGQSNMVGGPAEGAKFHRAPDPRLWIFALDQRWTPAKAPIHHMFEAVQPIHRTIRCEQHKITLERYDEMGLEIRAVYTKGGSCPGYAFGRRLAEALDRPVGLIACAECGTSIGQWNPALKDKGNESLYGAMLEQARLAGGPVRGLLWYQGESDCGGGVPHATAYQGKLLNLVDHLRRDTGNPKLAVIIVQIGRRVWANPKYVERTCEIVREGQRLAAGKRDNLYTVSAVDLSLHDNNVHVTMDGLDRVGARLAEVALTKVYGKSGHGAPIELDSVTLTKEGAALCVKVRLRGVTGRLRASSSLPPPFELRKDAQSSATLPVKLNAVFDPREPAAILLKFKNPVEPPFYLYYGSDHTFPANIIDEKDMPVPAFGPVEVRIKDG